MKKTGQCPKCEGKSIARRRARGMSKRAVETGVTAFSAKTPEMYVCKSCGFLEEYFTSDQRAKLDE